MTRYGLLNLGRDKKPGSTDRIDERILRDTKAKMVSVRMWVMFFVEIMEGDDNNERRLIRKVFPNARLIDRDGPKRPAVREPLLLSPALADEVESVKVFWVPNTAVRNWSPLRSVMRVRMKNGETYLTCHDAAGANGQGDRPSWARPLLQNSWNRTTAKFEQVERSEHQRGRDVTWMGDRNAYDLRTLPIQKGQRTIVHERTDWGRVWPADGHKQFFEPLPSVKMGLDSHMLLRMQGGYSKGR